ncbi:hypothetical protein QYE76_027709 [Lolium multiflorum]|uniref:Reverse transcriptase/retrotransposon-derived protein RNase H-like domain-containing protein n=1 Tax=Lolium multiflorum TaxID=4521 RepID=A0AAD8QJL4_LOLMU|nr:hypothetical protein QYE76_027709 [Lolium multiflorum]
MTMQAEISQPQQSPCISRRRTVITVTAATLSGKIPLMTRRVADPRWSPWLSNVEVKEAEEATVTEAEPAGVSNMVTRSPLPEPAPPKLTRRYKRAGSTASGKGGKGKNKDKEEDSSEAMDEDDALPDLKEGSAAKPNPFVKKSAGAYHTFLGTPTVRASKSTLRILETPRPIGRKMSWSETPSISRFVSRLGEKALPLYKLLKKTDKFVWDDAADAALQGLKEILTSPPILAAPEESEPMLLYLAATNRVISLVIVVERKEEGSRKLRHYFQEHPVTVVSKAPLSTILNNDATGRTAKWGIKLSAFDISYKARTAIKSEIVADFIADWTEAPDANLEPEPETWVMHFDGSKQHQGSGAGVTLKSPTGEELRSADSLRSYK